MTTRTRADDARVGGAGDVRLDPREREFYTRSVHSVARDLVGCVVARERSPV